MSLSMATKEKKRDFPWRISISLPHCRARETRKGFPRSLRSLWGECVCLCFPIKTTISMFSLNMGPNLHSETCPHSSAYCPYHNLHPFNHQPLTGVHVLETKGISGWEGEGILEKVGAGTNLTNTAALSLKLHCPQHSTWSFHTMHHVNIWN